jgi:hypothetical protein
VSVTDFLDAVPDERKRADAWKLVEIMREATGFEPVMWGPSIVGFGSYHYRYESGREGDICMVGFSPRKPAISLYVNTPGATELIRPMLEQFGKFTMGKGCIYIKRLSDIDIPTLKELIRVSVESSRH